LVALLSLRLGGSTSRELLANTFWPDSDGDKQAQNLRKAFSDVRSVLEPEASDPKILLIQGENVVLDPRKVATDVSQFKLLTDRGLSDIQTEASLAQAIELYRGPLLPDRSDSWIGLYRMELEERLGQSVERLISQLLKCGQHQAATLLGRRVLSLAPLREDIHVALMRAYASAGLTTEAIRQYEELEGLLQEHWGEQPSAMANLVLQGLSKEPARPVIPAGRESNAENSGGALFANSPFYIERPSDQVIAGGIRRRESTLLVQGPRQVGKSSLLARVLNESRSEGTKVALTDFQGFSRDQLATVESFYKGLLFSLARQLGAKLSYEEVWSDWLGPNSNLDFAVESVLTQVDQPVVWALDEGDRIFGTSFADDFYGLVRSWHNRRALDPQSALRHLTILISYATEAHLFIKDLNQSPFNIGLRTLLQDFDRVQIQDLASRYGGKLSTEETDSLWHVTRGHPYLTRKALDWLYLRGHSLEEICTLAPSESGPFSDHLRRLVEVVTRDPETAAEVGRLLRGETFLESKSGSRLIAGGLLVVNQEGKVDFRVPVYRACLARGLSVA